MSRKNPAVYARRNTPIGSALIRRGGNALYDMSADPDQDVNLIDDEGMASVVRELDDLLTGFFRHLF